MFRRIYDLLLRHIQPYCGMFRTLYNSYIFRTLSYLESWHVQNLRYIHNSVKAYCDIFRTLCNAGILLRTLPYSEFWHIQDPKHIQNPVYISTFRHIQTYLIVIVIIRLTFLHTFQRNLKRHMFFDYNDFNFNARLSLLRQYAIFQNTLQQNK